MVSLASPAGAMPPPPKPTPLRRPTLGHKRDSSYVSTDDEASLSTSTKKLKVSFDPNVDVRILDDPNDKSFELVKEEVRQGIEKHLAPGDQKDDIQYWALLKSLGHEASSSEALSGKVLKKYILAVDSRISSLGSCQQLVAAILDLAWLGRDDTFVGIFTKFLCDLLSVHAKYTQRTMENLVSYFCRLPSSLGRLPEETPVMRRVMFARLQLVIRTLIRQIPSAAGALMRAVRNEFPNETSTNRSYLQYEKHLIRLAEGSPEIKGEIIAMLVQRLVNLDVNIQQDIENWDYEEEEKLLQRPSSKDGDGIDSDASDGDSASESELTEEGDVQRTKDLRLRVAKMDGTLDLLFEYYTPLIQEESNPKTSDAYQQLLSHFTTFILPNRTRHAQFLVFHFSQTSPAHISIFIQHCLGLVSNETASIRIRLTACAYLASFIARASHISTDAIQQVFTTLCQFADGMRARYEPQCRGPDRRQYSLYYAITQSLVYIFCFRWRELNTGSTTPELDPEDFNEDDILAEGRDLAWLPGMKEVLSRNIYSRLNPLKVCSQGIVSEFAGIANHLRFLYVFPLLETNKRVRLGQTFNYYGSHGSVDIGRRETAWDRKSGEAHHQLEAYFPFDPYTLPKSKHWVANDYKDYKAPKGMEADGDDDNDDDGGYASAENEDESDAASVSDEDDLPLSRTAPISA